MTIRALIVEDEPLAIDRLRACLAYVDGLELVGEARDGETAIALIDRLQPDLVFLDIQLPLRTGFEVLRGCRHRPAVIFTTAHNEYAVSAFEWGAFDYLLKPLDRDRVRTAIGRFEQRSGFSDNAADSGVALAERLETAESKGALRRFFVKQRGVTVPVEAASIFAVLAEGDYCRVHVAAESHLVHLPLREFERRLAREEFLRVHRSALIHAGKVVRIEPAGRGAQVTLGNGLVVPASRAGAAKLKLLRL